MAKKIDWLYARKSCNTCKKAQAYMDELGTKVSEWVDATKVKYDRDGALELLQSIDRMVAVRGKKVEIFDLKENRPEDDVLASHLIGPTGNLRAPTARLGNTLVVGFNEEAYGDELS